MKTSMSILSTKKSKDYLYKNIYINICINKSGHFPNIIYIYWIWEKVRGDFLVKLKCFS